MTIIKITALVTFFAVSAFADTVTLTSVNGAVENGSYVSPYFMSIDGAAPIEVWCIDYLDHVTISETWDATINPDFGTYFPVGDYAKMLGIIQAELNDPSPDLAGYQNALWGIEDPADFAPPSGVYLADESTPLTVPFAVISGINPSDPDRPQEFVADAPTVSPEPYPFLMLGLGMGLILASRKWWAAQ